MALTVCLRHSFDPVDVPVTDLVGFHHLRKVFTDDQSVAVVIKNDIAILLPDSPDPINETAMATWLTEK